MKTLILLSGLAFLLIDCARHRIPAEDPAPAGIPIRGQVAGEDIPPPRRRASTWERPDVTIREMRPLALHQPLPPYPSQALESQVTCEVKLMYHVEKDGSASAVRFDWVVPPPDAHLEAFEAAILATVPEWRFEPAVRYLTRRMPDGSVDTVAEKVTRSKWMAIRFRVVEGRGTSE